ncbi:M23 family metallopeptidase [Frigidibacter sp. SD6-1]|uniref:M23 family metallopeptidase n=1 Tax=Frigidibacter sp. SD6-1 TaxID=3032581 RepID=UPI0024E0190A|nr:M23 family metallopeptidase [Frigidibacter sp. SD6-1]
MSVIPVSLHRLSAALERRLPEQRLFLKSDQGTRFIRIRPWTQALIFASSAVVVVWAILATAIIMIDSIGSGDARERARLANLEYESRLNTLSKERDQRAAEAIAAQERFTTALEQVSRMQSALLASEEQRRELETGIGLIQTALHDAVEARQEAETQLASLNGDTSKAQRASSPEEMASTLSFLTAALDQTAEERDSMAVSAVSAKAEADDIAYEMKLMEERHDEIFAQLEDAVTISMEPLDKVFTSVGIDPASLIDSVRSGYSGQGGPLGPLMPIEPPVDASPEAKADYERARAIFEGLDNLNLYRIAVDKTPLAMPLKTSFRYTSGFGRRWGRAHEGIDLAGAHGSPIYATADGVVTHAGWENGYGNMVEIRHPYGFVTRYGHLSKVRVEKGQKVSRGDRIGDMGNTGRSTGTHLHYEVRVSGSAVNPMSFIKAATNVF